MDARTLTREAEKFKQSLYARTAVVMDREGMLMMEFMQQRTTVKSEVYCETHKKT
jgi:hypothetical protein